MQYTTRFAAVALAAASFISSASAKTENLGVLTNSGALFYNTFDTATNAFTDIYTFTIAAPSTVSGYTLDTAYELFFTNDVVISSLTLSNAGSSTVLAQDTTPGSFTFSGLSAGNYALTVNGAVYGGPTLLGGAYVGTIKAVSTTGSSSIASPAPEPADYALTLVGLGLVGFLARRAKR